MTSSARRMVSSSFLAGVANWPAFSAADGQEEKGSAERTSQASSRVWGGGGAVKALAQYMHSAFLSNRPSLAYCILSHAGRTKRWY